MTTRGVLSSIWEKMSIQKPKKPKQKKSVIALTGGIASGKSYTLDFFKNNGFCVIDLDAISGFIYTLDGTNLALTKMFGTSEKSKIKEIVFNDKAKLLQLENYLHPKILQKMQEEIRQAKTSVIVAVPLLFEKKLYDYFDSVVVIVADEKVQIKRMIARDNIDEIFAKKILKNQANNQQRREISKHLPAVFIENNATIKDFNQLLTSFLELHHASH